MHFAGITINGGYLASVAALWLLLCIGAVWALNHGNKDTRNDGTKKG